MVVRYIFRHTFSASLPSPTLHLSRLRNFNAGCFASAGMNQTRVLINKNEVHSPRSFKGVVDTLVSNESKDLAIKSPLKFFNQEQVLVDRLANLQRYDPHVGDKLDYFLSAYESNDMDHFISNSLRTSRRDLFLQLFFNRLKLTTFLPDPPKQDQDLMGHGFNKDVLRVADRTINPIRLSKFDITQLIFSNNIQLQYVSTGLLHKLCGSANGLIYTRWVMEPLDLENSSEKIDSRILSRLLEIDSLVNP